MSNFVPFCPFYCHTSWEKEEIIEQLLKCGVVGASYLDNKNYDDNRWLIWKIPGDQVCKLPVDIGSENRYYSSIHYLPTKEHGGFSIYPFHDEEVKKYEAEPGAYWVQVK